MLTGSSEIRCTSAAHRESDEKELLGSVEPKGTVHGSRGTRKQVTHGEVCLTAWEPHLPFNAHHLPMATDSSSSVAATLTCSTLSYGLPVPRSSTLSRDSYCLLQRTQGAGNGLWLPIPLTCLSSRRKSQSASSQKPSTAPPYSLPRLLCSPASPNLLTSSPQYLNT